jgi:hypothetical protein
MIRSFLLLFFKKELLLPLTQSHHALIAAPLAEPGIGVHTPRAT